MSIKSQLYFWQGRVLVWFSCGVPSAVAAKMARDKYGDRCEVLYCDTSLHEHPDNVRFLSDVEEWIGAPIKRLRSEEYPDMDINTVFEKKGIFRFVGGGRDGAPCTDELKRKVRKAYQRIGDIHIFGYTWEELDRIELFENDNPSLDTEEILFEAFLTRDDCLRIIREAGIRLPALYFLGYHNNNCIGCVKGKKGYWNKVRRDYPEVFAQRAAMERKLGRRIMSECYLDELDPNAGKYDEEPSIECGTVCVGGGSHAP